MAWPLFVEDPATRTVPDTRRSFRRAWIIPACVIAGISIFYTIIFSIYWPFTKQDVIDTLQERSLRTVTIGRFRTTYFPPGCIAEQVNFLHIKHKNRPPLLTINRLVISTSYPLLFTFQRRLATVRLSGLHIMVPAKEPAGQPSPVMPLTFSNSKTSMPIDNLYADAAVLDFYRSSTPKPLHIRINKLAMHHIDANTALTYNVQLYNSEPPGTITSEGSFGPWNPKSPGTTPVHGSFRYDNANLAFFRELKGTLFADGKFDGNLGRINVGGAAHVPNFTLTGTSHKRRLAVTYQVGVNATNGNIDLTNVSADFDRTNLLVAGSISGAKGNPNKNLSFDVSSHRARIEDLTNLFISDPQAPMTGSVTFHLHAGVPANRDSFLRAMEVTGGFGIAHGKFASKPMEQGLTRLSESAKDEKPAQGENPVTLLSDLNGKFSAGAGVAHLSQTEFLIPGAHAWINGTYSLLNYQTDLHGVLITKGNVSATETGFKSFLLKALTPFFKRKNHARMVPFKIAGTYGHTNISLDLYRKQHPSPQ